MAARERLILKVSKVPDWGRRAIRLAIALAFFTSIAMTLWIVPVELRADWGDEVTQSCNWAGATCAVVAASPLIGKVAQLSYERTLGTVAGGFLGYVMFDWGLMYLPDRMDHIVLPLAAAAVGALSCWLSFKFKLDQSMRLFVITFLLVTFGAHPTKGAAAVALLRTGGIISGVLVLMSLTVIILPKSASIQSLRDTKAALKGLLELNKLVWGSCVAAARGSGNRPISRGDSGGKSLRLSASQLAVSAAATAVGDEEACLTVPLLKAGVSTSSGVAAVLGLLQAEDKAWEEYEEKCEKALTAVYASCTKAQDNLGLSASELYVWHFWGHYLFLPLFIAREPTHKDTAPGRGCLSSRWRLPAGELNALVTSIRRMARLQWTLHLNFAEGFGDATMARLETTYQPRLMEELAALLQASLQVLIDAFPNQPTIVVDSMRSFGDIVERMLHVTDEQRRAVAELLATQHKPTRPTRKLTHMMPEPQNVVFVSEAPAHDSGSAGGSPNGITRHISMRKQLGGDSIGRSEYSGAGARTPWGAGAQSFTGASSMGTSWRSLPMRQAFTLRESAYATIMLHRLQTVASEDSAHSAPPDGMDAVIARSVASGSAASLRRHSSSGVGRGGSYGPGAAAAAVAAFRKAAAVAEDGGAQGGSDGDGGGSEGGCEAAEPAPTPLLFPATEEGRVAEVRWHSFQFLMEELVEELEELYLAAAVVLERLPYGI